MKVSREQVALNRERIVETAARLFRQNGYDGIGVADLMKGAGLTHGGFYGHFASKEDLLAEATAHALQRSVQRWQEKTASDPAGGLSELATQYLSTRHRDHPENGCAIAALGPDVARLGPAVRSAMTVGVAGQVAVVEKCLAGEGGDAAAIRQHALATYAAMVGAMVLARAVDDEALSQEILAAVRAQIPASAPS
ncbi:UNVERIFIED_ORG: TetR family transcriptional regulator [Zoogloea ramigera]|uniref:TetR/AcrR family transcriptional regulator n=1 Tax=Duganella zoogloeoides TaxID=75659 RepID=A0ABZ0XTK3_9BURK|nr:TetR/AcrR family transcriptional regulator [Duganella zoogloeoides]WQH02480.1 TetR/AcrR family transcriptional regulator [Duganella zoogloeoides]